MHRPSSLRDLTLRGLFFLSALSLSSSVQASVNPQTEAEEAQITDIYEECAPYYYQPVSDALNLFPTVWSPASLVDGDKDAHEKWESIRSNIPDIAPKGTLKGNFSDLNYPDSDPDCWWTYNKCVTPKAPGILPDIAVMPEPQTLGYGFDDGPNCSHNAFYEYLSSQNQKATMFYVGSNVMNWPLQAQRAVKEGHEICVHSWSHNYMTSFKSEDAFAEIYYSDTLTQLKAIKLVTGVTPTCWRPPFGDTDDRIRAIASGLGLKTIIWGYDSQDWQFGDTDGFTAEDVAKNYQQMIDDADNGHFDHVGAIILAHELNNFTMQEAVKYYPILKRAFAHIVPVGVGLNITHPYVEKNYTQPTFDEYVADTTVLGKKSADVQSTSPTASSSTSRSSATGAPSFVTSSTTTLAQAESTQERVEATAVPQNSESSAKMGAPSSFLAALLCVVGALIVIF